MRFLGIDYGEKRIGLSYGDELGVAVPLEAATERRKRDRLRHIEEVVSHRKITTLVVGYPLNMDGSAGFKAREVDRFIEILSRRLPVTIHRIDESLTTFQAETEMRSAGKRVSRKSGQIDSLAATLILQEFLDSQPS